jgi:hypothetical protein
VLPYVRPESPPVVRLLRAAPTVSAFLHDAGEPIESQSTKPGAELNGLAAVPSLPAAMTMSMSRRSAAYASTSLESTV